MRELSAWAFETNAPSVAQCNEVGAYLYELLRDSDSGIEREDDRYRCRHANEIKTQHPKPITEEGAIQLVGSVLAAVSTRRERAMQRRRAIGAGPSWRTPRHIGLDRSH